MNIIVIDSSKNSVQMLLNILNKIQDANVVGNFEDFSSINCALDTIDLIIFDIKNENCEKTLDEIKKIKNKNPSINTIATSYDINSELVSKVLKEGIDDFLIKPTIESIFLVSYNKIQNLKNKISTLCTTYCLYSPKNASGQTSIGVNVAWEISKQTNTKTLFLDLSSNFSDMETFLDLPAKYTFKEILQKLNSAEISNIINICDNYKNSNLYVLSFKDFIGLNVENIAKLINSLKNTFARIVIDSPSGFNEINGAIFDNSDVILFVALLNLASTKACQISLEMFENAQIDTSKIKLIINRYIENSQINIFDFRDTVKFDVYFKIPNNYLTLIDAINRATPTSETNPNSNIAKAYVNLAGELINECANTTSSSGMSRRNIYNFLRRMGE